MSLVYCCHSSKFYHAVSCWSDDRTDEDSLFILPSFRSFFCAPVPAGRDTTPVIFFMPGTPVLTFQATYALEHLKPWINKNIMQNPAYAERIQQVGKLMAELISNENWAVSNGLIVSDLLSESERRFA